MFNQVDKKTAKEWENQTTPILNIISSNGSTLYRILVTNGPMMKLFCWDYQPNLKTTKEKKAFLKTKWGYPLYHVVYEYREAVWAFLFEECPVLIYYSEKGFSIQVDPQMTLPTVKKLLKYLLSTQK